MLLAPVVLVSSQGLASSAQHHGIKVGSSLHMQGNVCLWHGCGVLVVCLFMHWPVCCWFLCLGSEVLVPRFWGSEVLGFRGFGQHYVWGFGALRYCLFVLHTWCAGCLIVRVVACMFTGSCGSGLKPGVGQLGTAPWEVGSSLCVQGSICLCYGCGVLAACLFVQWPMCCRLLCSWS